MALKLIEAPTDEGVTLAEAKAQLTIEENDWDTLIQAILDAAVSHVDGPRGFLGRALSPQTWDLYLDTFPVSGVIEAPLPPLISVEGVYYRDSEGVEQEVSADLFIVDDASEPARIVLKTGSSWPTPDTDANAVRVRFTAGYQVNGSSPPEADWPKAIKQAVLLLVGTMFANRETVVIGETVAEIPFAAEHLLRPFRVHVPFA